MKILILIALILILSTNQSLSFTCSDYINDHSNKISNANKSLLCEMIKANDKNYHVFLRTIDDINSFSKSNDDYTNENNNFLNSKCNKDNVCHKTISVTIYTNARKLRISLGNEANNYLNHERRELIINYMKSFLKDNNFFDAFFYSLSKINVFYTEKR